MALRQILKLHRDWVCDALTSIEVDVERTDTSTLLLRYGLRGRMADIRIPAPASPTRADELWKRTCFEAFVRGDGDAYYEFNFSPSTQWAAYEFTGYRAGMRAAEELSAPAIAMKSDTGYLELSVSLALDRLTLLRADAELRIGLSAVIEETNGRKSYWALAHPPGKPDFHHSDCFVLSLPGTSCP